MCFLGKIVEHAVRKLVSERSEKEGSKKWVKNRSRRSRDPSEPPRVHQEHLWYDNSLLFCWKSSLGR